MVFLMLPALRRELSPEPASAREQEDLSYRPVKRLRSHPPCFGTIAGRSQANPDPAHQRRRLRFCSLLQLSACNCSGGHPACFLGDFSRSLGRRRVYWVTPIELHLDDVALARASYLQCALNVTRPTLFRACNRGSYNSAPSSPNATFCALRLRNWRAVPKVASMSRRCCEVSCNSLRTCRLIVGFDFFLFDFEVAGFCCK